jgi:hypothetical protein
MGWTPQTVLSEASLNDLCLALEGYREFHGIASGNSLSRTFLNEMINKFPDKPT